MTIYIYQVSFELYGYMHFFYVVFLLTIIFAQCTIFTNFKLYVRIENKYLYMILTLFCWLGFVIFSIIGFMAQSAGVEVNFFMIVFLSHLKIVKDVKKEIFCL